MDHHLVDTDHLRGEETLLHRVEGAVTLIPTDLVHTHDQDRLVALGHDRSHRGRDRYHGHHRGVEEAVVAVAAAAVIGDGTAHHEGVEEAGGEGHRATAAMTVGAAAPVEDHAGGKRSCWN